MPQPAIPTATTVLDSMLFRDAFGTPHMREVFSDYTLISRYTEVEIALARAEARCGVIPAEAAEEIAAKCNVAALDFDLLRHETDIVGYPTLPLVHQLVKQCGEAGRYVHWGATTQDIMDTADVLRVRARRVNRRVEDEGRTVMERLGLTVDRVDVGLLLALLRDRVDLHARGLDEEATDRRGHVGRRPVGTVARDHLPRRDGVTGSRELLRPLRERQRRVVHLGRDDLHLGHAVAADDLHDAVDVTDLGLALGDPGLEQLLDARQTRGDVETGDATGV